MRVREQMESIYRDFPLDEIPWNHEQPPELLVELVETRRILPCRAVDLGCGAGNYAVWLATKGFEVTGVDISPKAIELASDLADRKGVACRFVVGDLTEEIGPLGPPFDFAYDWEVLHHVFPDKRHRYVANVHRLLRPGGRYLSVCFSEEDLPSFGGTGKYRTTPLGTTLYFSSALELRELFEPLFDIEELTTVEVPGRQNPHVALKAILKKTEQHRDGGG